MLFGVMILTGIGRRSIWSRDEKAGFRRLLPNVLLSECMRVLAGAWTAHVI
jgi:hypothetical protein